MKYEIKQQFISKNRSGKPLTTKGGVQHETANPGATAQNHFKYFNGADRKASAHAFVDWMEIVQFIPWNEQAWHAGPTANRGYIGIEWCRPKAHDPLKFAEVWKRGVWLWAWIYINVLKTHTVTIDNLISHDDCRKRFGDTTHTDPIVYFKEYGKTLDDLRKDVQTEINAMLQSFKAVGKGIVIASKLNVRKEPTTKADNVVCTLSKGAEVSILEKSPDGNWYRIEKGWVSSLHVNIKE